ncbi:MAG: sulfotransferase family protein [Gammaproteobacteria bacterium]|nr:MAG: sulfotransferase family protein [Gammaproteobacteria bacterium]
MHLPLFTRLKALPGRCLSLLRQWLWPEHWPGTARYLQRLVILAIALPPFVLLQAAHLVGFLLDEVLFRRHREVEVRAPVFVLGVPRSGTTFTHRLLAAEPTFTTLTLWECVFAPSISERYVFAGLARLDGLIGRPVGRLLHWLSARMARMTGDVHPTALGSPEEDFLTLLPTLDCFLLVIAFPEAKWLWQLTRGDRDLLEEADGRCPPLDDTLFWYRQLLQKHLFFHGESLTLLSKNASFAGLALSLEKHFPDCRIVICERDAGRVLQSQFRSLADARRFFGTDTTHLATTSRDHHTGNATERGNPLGLLFERELVDTLAHYYENLELLEATLPPERCIRVPLEALSGDTGPMFQQLCRQLTIPCGDGLMAAIEQYRSEPANASPKTGAGSRHLDVSLHDINRRFARWMKPRSEPL